MASEDIDVVTLRSRARVLSTIDCPPITARPVRLLYPRPGADPFSTIHVQRPIFFEKICTAVVDEVAKPPPPASPDIRSGRDVARSAYHRVRGIDANYGAQLHFDRPVLDLRSITSGNFSLLVNEIIPLCLHVRSHVGADVGFAMQPFGQLEAKCRELLDMFSIEPIVTHKRIAGPIVHVRGTRELASYDLQDVFDTSMITFFPDTYRNFRTPRTVHHEKIFLSRRDARSLLNSREVERMLEAQGYTTIYMEDYSVADQISIGAQARHVVAIHGAAMAFLSFNPAIESVIELSPPHVYHAFFPLVIGSRARRYVLVIQEFDELVVQHGWKTIVEFKNQRFAVNLGLLERALEDVRCGP